MDLSRRQFLQLSTGAGAGTAVGTLVGLGVNLTPATTRAQHLRIQDAKVTPSVCPYCSVGCATLVPARSLDDDAMHQMTAGVHNSPNRECYFRECYLTPIALNLLGRSRQVSSG